MIDERASLRLAPVDLVPGDRWNDQRIPRQMGTTVIHAPSRHSTRPGCVYVVFSNHKAYYLPESTAYQVERAVAATPPAAAEEPTVSTEEKP